MQWTRIAGLVGVLVVVVTAGGAVGSLATSGLLTGQLAVASLVVLALVAVLVAAMVFLGTESRRTSDAPGHYW